MLSVHTVWKHFSVMSFHILALTIMVSIAASTTAFAWQEPPRGSKLRKDLMNTIRPIAGLHLTPPIEFVVRDLRVDGDFAFALLDPQRPGGIPIDWYSTLGSSLFRTQRDFENFGIEMIVFFERVRGIWYIRDYSIGASDLWYAGSRLCADYGHIQPYTCLR